MLASSMERTVDVNMLRLVNPLPVGVVQIGRQLQGCQIGL